MLRGLCRLSPSDQPAPIPFKQLGGIEEARLPLAALPSAIMGMKKIRRRWQGGRGQS
jgi:hypothetical protein